MKALSIRQPWAWLTPDMEFAFGSGLELRNAKPLPAFYPFKGSLGFFDVELPKLEGSL